ncbi:ThuA domain-containing protein [Pelagicoccus mobilis]|uniref:ThuA domain-containing protein n=1 Tax=Pelagicoccus mobilis TaxID=415221 RepID=A0A934RZ08_9BACT|nr:ThuA domain-containing protein [Pelagicoccus mobilis]MBK1879206.1 ThuA domain-containing protein [Pelagicoccus mobilis]
MKHLVLICFGLILSLMGGCSKSLKVHMLSGSKEYNSAESLALWSEHLENRYGIESSFTWSEDKAKTVTNLEALKDADVLVVFCRRWELEGEQAQAIIDWCESGKPVLAIRTASHAFQFYKEFDSKILGGNYSGHGPAEDEVSIQIVDENSSDPLLEGLAPWQRPGKVYRNPEIAQDCQVLLRAQSPLEDQAVAWKRVNGEQRVFYTSLGLPDDFQNPKFVGLLDRALHWVAEARP